MNIAVFASHGGSDLQAIIDGCKQNTIHAKVVAVISNNSASMALQRAKNEGIDGYHLSAKQYTNETELANAILSVLENHRVDLIFLAGYMRMLHDSILRKYKDRVFNIHPALLPKYGGKGMYGMYVHQAVIAAGETETGVTIHRVNEEYDSGEIVAQTTVPVQRNDTAESLAARVLQREHTFLVEVIRDIADGKILLGENHAAMPPITLIPMTEELHHKFYQDYENDPDLYMDESKCTHFVYTPQWVEAYIARQKEKGRLVFAVLEDGRPVGEVVLKNIDRDKKECAFGIVLQNDSMKNRGIGTKAEKLMVDYAIDCLGMETIYADAILKNKRSQHVLEKVGFVQTGADDTFVYYQYQRK